MYRLNCDIMIKKHYSYQILYNSYKFKRYLHVYEYVMNTMYNHVNIRKNIIF